MPTNESGQCLGDSSVCTLALLLPLNWNLGGKGSANAGHSLGLVWLSPGCFLWLLHAVFIWPPGGSPGSADFGTRGHPGSLLRAPETADKALHFPPHSLPPPPSAARKVFRQQTFWFSERCGKRGRMCCLKINILAEAVFAWPRGKYLWIQTGKPR